MTTSMKTGKKLPMPNDKLPERAQAAVPADREPKMYVHKHGEPFKAVQWTGSNMDAVREVYPGLGEEYMRDKGCGIGFWVVSPYPGRVYFLTDEDFRSNYEQASRLSQAQPKHCDNCGALNPLAFPGKPKDEAQTRAEQVQRVEECLSAKDKLSNFTPNPVEWMNSIRGLLFALGMKEEMSNWSGSFDGWGVAFEWIKYHVKRSQALARAEKLNALADASPGPSTTKDEKEDQHGK
jgi:hypothetical protein